MRRNFALEKNLSVLTQRVEERLRQLRYSEATILDYHYFWNKLSRYMEHHKFNEYDQPLAEMFLYETYGISLTESTKGHSNDSRHCRRALIILLDYQKHGKINRRQHTISHEFQECYKPIIDNYMVYLDSTMAVTTRRTQKYKLIAFLNFLFEHDCHDLSRITKTIVLDYWKTLSSRAKATQTHDAYVLRTFLTYLYEHGITLVDNAIFVPVKFVIFSSSTTLKNLLGKNISPKITIVAPR